MSDRELLEKAAKAAGIDWFKHTDGGLWLKSGGIWNPITDDGDALRLAVKLEIQITPGTYDKDEFTAFKAAGGEAHEYLNYLQDEYAATRRAIVRTAAQIGARNGNA